MRSRTDDQSTPLTHTAVTPRDTTCINRMRQDFSDRASVWVFGYGSLIYKVDFPCLERQRAAIHGWARRFWQGSHDHRGTPEHPGRVLTLVPEAGAICTGMAYRVAPATFGLLDFREKNGYLRTLAKLDFGAGESTEGVVYIAPQGNAAWLGPASVEAIARCVVGAAGPSGSNIEYVFKLADALRVLGARDAHVFAVEACLLRLRKTE
ncbi:MAG: gamma-glutamylcyclotransferase [Gammaproteobacteria bacterium]